MAILKLLTHPLHSRRLCSFHQSARLVILIILIPLALVGVAFAQESIPAIDWWTVASGGGNSSEARYTLIDTIGQPLVGGAISGGEYVLLPGYWTTNPEKYNLYLPMLNRQP